jgi:hypothetical protein
MATRTRSTRKQERYSVSQLSVIHAKANDTDATTSGKRIRARFRANFADMCKADATIGKVKSAANDGNRWPEVNIASIEAAYPSLAALVK